MLISIFSPISFLAPEVHLTDLEKIWTDQVVNNPTWKPFIAKLLDEWQEFVLYVRPFIYSLELLVSDRSHLWFFHIGNSLVER